MAEIEKYFGAMLYVQVGESQVEGFLSHVLGCTTGSVAGTQMVSYRSMPANSDSFRRARRVTPSSLTDLLASCLAGDASHVIVESATIGRAADSTFALSVEVTPNREGIRTVQFTGPYELYQADAVLEYLSHVSSDIACRYGCVLSAKAFVAMFSLLTFTPISPWDRPPDGPEAKLEAELIFYQKHMRDLGRQVPRAYWGNVLSSVHAAGLGGEERIRKESGCYLVERWGENLYLQLTESIWDVTKDDLLRLNHYFEPIRFPGAPEPVFPD